jgi:hypothetical protein
LCSLTGQAFAGLNVEDSGQTFVSIMRDTPDIRPDSTPDRALTTPRPVSLGSIWAATKRLLRARSLSRVQAVVGTLAGIATITGGSLSVVQAGRAANTGDLVAIVKGAGGRVSVPDATIEVLTPQNAIVATLTPDATGRASQDLREGVYVVRISHPRYAAEVRRVQVVPRHTVEIRATLRPGSSSPTPIDHAVNSTVSAVRRALHF